MSNSLYICYFGLLEPLVQTQVLPYLRELLKGGHQISLLTFEPHMKSRWTANKIKAVREQLAAEGIRWDILPYHKRLSVIATGYDVLRGAMFIRNRINGERTDILHGRVHIPVLMAAIARKFSTNKPKLLFDIRGFFPEEYADAGIWKPNGLLYRTVKKVEAWLMKEADGFVVLTEKARAILFPESTVSGVDKDGRPVEVIPCCVDLEKRFTAEAHGPTCDSISELGLERRFVLTHVGALGGLYLTENIADFLSAARIRRPDTFALFLTQSDPSLIVPLLQDRGFSSTDHLVKRVSPDDVPTYLRASDVALSFVKASYSTQSRSPTKNAEYLACGLPIIANDGVGDVTEQITEDCTGIILREFNDSAYNEALDKLDELMSDRAALALRCRQSAKRRFDLERVGGDRYRRIYQILRES